LREKVVRELQPKLFKRAVEIAGDAQKLGNKLHVDPHSLHLWLEGRATAPGWVLQLVIDLIVDDDLARAAQDRRQQPRSKDPPDEKPPPGAITGPQSP
jgi:hypothetical protein